MIGVVLFYILVFFVILLLIISLFSSVVGVIVATVTNSIRTLFGLGGPKRKIGWFGKVVGGTLGFGVGGPLGAVIGVVLGSMVDRDFESQNFHSAREQSEYLEKLRIQQLGRVGAGPNQAQALFFISVFSMIAKLARVDGNVTQGQIDTIETLMSRVFQLDAQRREFAIQVFRAAKESPDPFEAFAAQYFALFHARPELLEQMIDILLAVALADGTFSSEEDRLISVAVRIFGISEGRYQQLRARYAPGTGGKDYYAVLGVKPDDSMETIRKSYRKLVLTFHPDRLAAQGLADEFRKFSEGKFKEIQEAYEMIRKERGAKT